MNKEKVQFRIGILLLFILAIAAMRVANSAQLTMWANFTPIGALGLFGGHYFKKSWQAFLLPLGILFISDLVINSFVFGGKYGIMYDGWYIIYAAFILIVIIGKFLIRKVSALSVILASIVATALHWGLADFAVWLAGGTDLRTMTPFAKNWEGLVQCYTQGAPFAKNFLLGTVSYSAVLFGSIEWMKAKRPKWVLLPARG